MSIAKHHAEWLSLVDISGPFLNITSLQRVFPQGLDALDTPRAQELRSAYEEWSAEARRDPRYHWAWVRYVLETVLEWNNRCLADGQAIPEPLKYTAFDQGSMTVRPDYVLHQPGHPNQARALVCVYPHDIPLEKPMRAAWSASPAARTLALLRATGVRLGIVTNGEQWMLISAPPTGLAGYVSWYAELWLEERLTLRAFISLLCVRRFFGVADEDTLEAMLDESANAAQEVTDQLGLQVRRAVEILVRALDRADQDSGGVLLNDVSERVLYQAALTVMMRLVFLLSAEERGLFLLGDPLYDQSYAVSMLRAQLHETADRLGEDVLERRGDAWGRLLATFRLVYFGAAHEDLRLPAYGGSLFDPDRFEFLEGRGPGLNGTPPFVDNRTVLHLLDALQVLQTKGEARRLSFRALDIEQIGHVYEGLLDHEARRATEVMLGFTGSVEPEIPLSALLGRAETEVHEFLKEVTGRSSVSPIRNALRKPFDADRVRRLRIACHSDDDLFNAVLPFINLLRDDEFGYPVVILPDSFFVTAGTERRATGTHYTPRALTEPIVQHTLEPLVYVGPAEGLPADQWQLKSPRELLALKVCDMAMGSGAFLVQACRYLAARLIEAWDDCLEAAADPIPRLTIEGDLPSGALTEILISDDENERQTVALRLIADRCLYGVDKNPLAVEMAKLSLWLTTLAKGRPFTFLDHALKCGDSLLGVSLDQLRKWNLDTGADDVPLFRIRLGQQIDEVVALRVQLESFPVNEVSQQQRKQELYDEAEEHLYDLRTAADHLVLSYLVDGLDNAGREDLRLRLLDALMNGHDITDDDRESLWPVFQRYMPFHWELEFPEVFLGGRGGFDAFVGNPPFQGGQKITGALGVPYREYLISALANGQRGSADLCAYFYLRAFDLLRPDGQFGLIATNTIAQGDTREVGLDAITQSGGVITWANNNQPWPGDAAVVVNVVHVHKGDYAGTYMLDGLPASHITPLLDAGETLGNPHRLAANAGKSFQGSIVLGMGFVLTLEEAQALIDHDPRNADVLFPYLNGQDLNSRPDQSPSRWVINFFDWPLERAEEYPDCISIVREKVKPERDKQKREIRKRYWWRYGEIAPALYRTIAPLRRVLVIARVSKTGAFVFLPKGWVYNEKTVVFPFEEARFFGLLQSSFHNAWVWNYSSTLKSDLNYAPSDAFETFPFPYKLAPLEEIGETYHEARRQIMLARQEGLTATYNRFHNPTDSAADIDALRRLHIEMDYAVATAYGWSNLDLVHDFHETRQGMRYTISEAARREVLRRLLALNFERHEEEQLLGADVPAQGNKGGAPRASASPPSGNDPGDPPEQLDLFDDGTPKQPRLF